MGIEAYRLGVSFTAKVSKNDVVNAILGLNGEIVYETEYGDISLEIVDKDGYIEILLENPAEKESALKTNANLGQTPNYPNKVLMYIQFEKPNSVNLVDKIMVFINSLNMVIPVKRVIDFQTNEDIHLNNYESFRTSALQMKSEFDSWFPRIPYSY